LSAVEGEVTSSTKSADRGREAG